MNKTHAIPKLAANRDVYQIVHEIGNPLNGMATTVELMERHLNSMDPSGKEFIVAALKDLRSEINRLRRILADVRSSDPHCTELAPTDLCSVVEAVLRTQNLEFKSHRVQVVKRFPAEAPAIIGNAGKLQQVLLNLFKNAIEGMPSGGTLTVRVERQDPAVLLEVADTGVGIPSDLDVFRDGTTTKDGSMGLGLAIVREIMAAHGGQITYESNGVRGTCFRLTFVPAGPGDPSPRGSHSSPARL